MAHLLLVFGNITAAYISLIACLQFRDHATKIWTQKKKLRQMREPVSWQFFSGQNGSKMA